MPIAEPTTLVSDFVLAAVAMALAVRLHRAGAWRDGRARRLWSAAFLAGAVAALAGGIVHGFSGALTPWVHDVLWKTVLAGTGLAGALILAGAGIATLPGSWLMPFLAGVAGLRIPDQDNEPHETAKT